MGKLGGYTSGRVLGGSVLSGYLRRFPWLLLAVYVMLNVMGFVTIASVDVSFATRQALLFLTSAPLVLFISLLKPKYLLKLAYLAYFGGLVALALTLVVGDVSMGARRWIDFGVARFQPSEVAKLGLAFALARYYHFEKERNIGRLRSTIVPLLITLVPAALIAKQPDLGSAIVTATIGITVIFACGLKWRFFIIAGLLLGLAAPFVWSNMHDYQRQRIQTFLDVESDPLGSGYNIIQSKIAIGSGGSFGKGLFAGSQGKLEFLPESHTDFAFTIYAEQFGFAGSLTLLALYFFIIFFGYYTAVTAESHFTRVLSVAISSSFFTHIMVNIAMTSGAIPVVGSPLPFISYGGTFMFVNACAIGVLINMRINRDSIITSATEVRGIPNVKAI